MNQYIVYKAPWIIKEYKSWPRRVEPKIPVRLPVTNLVSIFKTNNRLHFLYEIEMEKVEADQEHDPEMREQALK